MSEIGGEAVERIGHGYPLIICGIPCACNMGTIIVCKNCGYAGDVCGETGDCSKCQYDKHGANCGYAARADYFIANGVTIATDNNVGHKWIPLSERKPGRDELVLVFFDGMRDTPAAIQVIYGWCISGSATHWMPLPQPPKGEEE